MAYQQSERANILSMLNSSITDNRTNAESGKVRFSNNTHKMRELGLDFQSSPFSSNTIVGTSSPADFKFTSDFCGLNLTGYAQLSDYLVSSCFMALVLTL